MADLTSLQRKRRALVKVITKELFPQVEQKVKIWTDQVNPEDIGEIQALVASLEQSAADVKAINDEIIDKLTEDKDVEAVLGEKISFDLEIKRSLAKLTWFKRSTEIKKESEVEDRSRISGSQEENATGTKRNVKLPPLSLDYFSGDPLQWQTFIDVFEASVHRRTDLEDVQKFQYLSGYLRDSAKKCIEGFQITNTNYEPALNMLKERFGNSQMIISAHMTKMMEMKNLHSDYNVKDLRNILETIESHV